MKGQEISGITLIALVVTIIVLLILAGVSISMLTGQNGILNRSAEAKEKTEMAQSKEKVKLAVTAAIADGNGTLTIENLKKELSNNGITIPDSATFPVTVTIGNSSYQIDQTGNITEASTTPQISYTVTNTDGTEITDTANSNLPESAKLNVTITNISELTVTSIKIKNSSGTEITGATIDVTKGTISTQITENGKYIVEIVATDKKGKNASASPEIQVSGKLKIANLEANWTVADSTNSNDDWYAYKDNSGAKAQVNGPKLADGMTAIKYSTDSDLTAGSKWANAMTKDGSMWVWIPRYAYRITYTDSTNRRSGGTIDIAFLKGTTNEFLDSSIKGDIVTAINADGTVPQGKWVLEPAFTLGTESIEGFWFAKFEASNNNDSVQIKPNVSSWRNISSASIFTTCLNLISNDKYSTYFNNVSNVDTHMTKNVEWGAVAYLAHSKYGLNGKEICINTNSSYKTGIGSGETASTTSVTDQYNTTKGVTASTTKNVYGIYDMSGGAYEYVAACYTGYTKKLTTNTDTTYINKYIDVYESYNSPRFGDAVLETSSSSSGSTSWFSDYSGFVNSSFPVFGRGGYYGNGSGAGLFFFFSNGGVANSNGGFRPVCVVK